MNTRLSSLMVGLVLLLGVAVLATPNRGLVLGILSPFPNGGDEVEQDLRLYLGGFPGLEAILQPRNPEEFFGELAKMTKKGRQVDRLFIAAHGNIEGKPTIKLASDHIDPDDVDYLAMQQLLKDSLEMHSWEVQQHQGNPDPDLNIKIESAQQQREVNREKLRLLDQVYDSTASGCQIVMLNCSAAKPGIHRAMLDNFGRVLLGRRGGSIVACTQDIDFASYENRSRLRQLMSGWAVNPWRTDFMLDLDFKKNWVHIPVQPQLDPFLFVAFDSPTFKLARAGEEVVIPAPKVDARPDSGELQYSWDGGPASSNPSWRLRVVDNPQHRRDVSVSVRDAQGRVAKDTFTLFIQAVEIRGAAPLSPGQNLKLTASVQPAIQGARYRWRCDARELGNQPQIAFQEQSPGDYPITLEVRDAQGNLVGSDRAEICVSNPGKPLAPQVAAVSVVPSRVMATEFFELTCALPESLRKQVTAFEWLYRLGASGEQSLSTTSQPRMQLQLLPHWVGANFGVRLLNSRQIEVAKVWARFDSFATVPTRFSATVPESWQVTQNDASLLRLEKPPTLRIADQDGEARASGDGGGGLFEARWVSLAAPDSAPKTREWQRQGNTKSKGRLAFQGEFRPKSWILVDGGGPDPVSRERRQRLTDKYRADYERQVEHTARQAEAIMESLTVTPDGEIRKVADTGTPTQSTGANPPIAPPPTAPPGPPPLTSPSSSPPPATPRSDPRVDQKIGEAASKFSANQIEEATRLALEARALNPQQAEPALQEFSQNLVRGGWDLALQNRYTESRQALTAALSLSPGLSEAARRLDRVKKAERVWPEVLRLGEQLEEKVRLRQVFSAYSILKRLVDLGNELIYEGSRLHPRVAAWESLYASCNQAFNQCYERCSTTVRQAYLERDSEMLMQQVRELEPWELNEANQAVLGRWREWAARIVEEQASATRLAQETKQLLAQQRLDPVARNQRAGLLSNALEAFGPKHSAQRSQIVALVDRLKAISAPPQTPGDRLAVGQSLSVNSCMQSASGQIRLMLQGDGNLVLTRGARVLWSPQTEGRGVIRLELGQDGVVRLVTGEGRAVWQSHSGTNSGTYYLQVQDDGNVVVYVQNAGAARAVWATHTAQAANMTDSSSAQVPPPPTPPPAIPPPPTQGGQQMAGGQNLSPNSWLQSPNGQFRLTLQEDGNLVLAEGGRALWSPQTEGKGVNCLSLTRDGTVVLASRDGRRIWQSHPGSGEPGTYTLHVQDDGNVVVYAQEGGGARPIWATNTAKPRQAVAPPTSRPNPPSRQNPQREVPQEEWEAVTNGQGCKLRFTGSRGEMYSYYSRSWYELRDVLIDRGSGQVRFTFYFPDRSGRKQIYRGRLTSARRMEGSFDCDASGKNFPWYAELK